MSVKTRYCLVFFALAMLVQITAYPQSNRIATDKSVKIGKLPNGLTYYIRKNAQPAERAELRLVVNAGSVQENEGQQGIAHFLEHMAFNGTEHFPKNELLGYLQNAGVRFGADLNATTGFEYTIYMIPLPTTDAVVLQNGYQVLRDWAGGLLLDTAEISKERGVILEEKRLRQNAGMRSFMQYLPALTNNSLFSKRIPIGQEEIIKTASRNVFEDFYKAWYRPGNMAVMVVGDIDPEKTEQTIRSLFGDLKNPVGAPERPAFIPVAWHKSDKALVVSDAENTNNILTIDIGLKQMPAAGTWDQLAEEKLNEVIVALFDGRLAEYAVNPKSPVSYANINLNSDFINFRNYKTASINALVKDNPVEAIQMMVAELLKAKVYGFTKDELERVKKNLLTEYETALLEKGKTESARLINEYVDHFLNQSPIPGIEAEQQFVKKMLDQLTLEKVNQTVSGFDLNAPAFVLFNATSAVKSKVAESDLLAAYQQAKLKPAVAYVEKKTGSELMDIQPVPGKILSVVEDKELESKTLSLSNGMRVIYKKTNFKNDEIMFRASQWGGFTNLTDAEIAAAKYYNLVGGLGLGKNKAADVPKLMAGVNANAVIAVTPTQLVSFGNAGVTDLEKLFQLLYMKFTRVNFDREDFEGLKSTFSSQVAGLLKNPGYKFSDTLNKFKYGYSPRIAGFPVSAELDALQLEMLEQVHKKITGNLNGLVLVFSGNIDEAVFSNLVCRYLASVPTQATSLKLDKEKILIPLKGKNTFTMQAGKENKSEINYNYYGDAAGMADAENLAFTLLAEILQMKANAKLREEMGSTYSPMVRGSVLRSPVGTFDLTLSVSSLPDNAGKIIDAYEALVKDLIGQEVSDDDLAKAKAQRIKVVETQKQTNAYWTNLLEQQWQYGISGTLIKEYTARVNGVTKADIKNVAAKYLTGASILKGLMNPE